MITRIKTNGLEYLKNDIDIQNIKQHNIIVAQNGWGKTKLIKAIRDKLFENQTRQDIRMAFSKEFAEKPKGIHFVINEELDARAVKDSINPFDGATYGGRLCESITKSELSNGQDQKRTIEMFMDELITGGTIWFLDEPEKSLDIVEMDRFINKILTLNSQIFIITHSPLLLKDDRFNKIILDDVYFKNAMKILGE